jgi:hypothetical protein
MQSYNLFTCTTIIPALSFFDVKIEKIIYDYGSSTALTIIRVKTTYISGVSVKKRIGFRYSLVFLSKRTKMILDKYKNQIQILCRENKVKDLFVFGSVLTAKFNEDSDIDFIVDIDSSDPIEYADHYFALKFSLEDLLKRPIDLLENKAIKNPFLLQQIEKTKSKLYGSGN